jgi:hypothetical protein
MPIAAIPDFIPPCADFDWTALAGRAPDGFIDAPPAHDGTLVDHLILFQGMPECPFWTLGERRFLAQPTPLAQWEFAQTTGIEPDADDHRVGFVLLELPGVTPSNGVVDVWTGETHELAAAIAEIERRCDDGVERRSGGFCVPDATIAPNEEIHVFETKIAGRRAAIAGSLRPGGECIARVGGIVILVSAGFVPHFVSILPVRSGNDAMAAADSLRAIFNGNERREGDETIFLGSIPSHRLDTMTLISTPTLRFGNRDPIGTRVPGLSSRIKLPPAPETLISEFLEMTLGTNETPPRSAPGFDEEPSAHERLAIADAMRTLLDAPFPEDVAMAFGRPAKRTEILSAAGFVKTNERDDAGGRKWRRNDATGTLIVTERPDQQQLETRTIANDDEIKLGSAWSVRDIDGIIQRGEFCRRRISEPTTRRRRRARFEADRSPPP